MRTYLLEVAAFESIQYHQTKYHNIKIHGFSLYPDNMRFKSEPFGAGRMSGWGAGKNVSMER